MGGVATEEGHTNANEQRFKQVMNQTSQQQPNMQTIAKKQTTNKQQKRTHKQTQEANKQPTNLAN